ncbi:MAG: ATP-grasp domain-containing protein [Chloroflexi bacterium]|nr:ATP-grasp domain-containing protein [Chloroflexota bacterium]
MRGLKDVLLVCPSAWDKAQIPASGNLRGKGYRLRFVADEAEDYPSTFDALSFIDATVRELRERSVDGVTSSSDYPGCIVAAAIARELGLPGAAPETVLTCSHKYYSRVAQREAAPQATPAFAIIDPDTPRKNPPGLSFPLFVKPVKSWFSILAEKIDSLEELQTFAARPDVKAHLLEFVGPFNRLLARYTDFCYSGSHLIAEEILSGDQVTVEGFSFGGEVEIAGIVDSVMFPGTKSFQRFDYPSSLPEGVQRRMGDVARRVIAHVGLDNSLFNVEMFYDRATDRIGIIEINPRMCGQFADMLESVNGTNTYEILLGLATGERPAMKRMQGRYKVAASFPLRVFRDMRVRRVPAPEDIERVKREFPVTIVKMHYAEGQRLSDVPDNSDGPSYRYGVVNMAGDDLRSMLAEFEEVRRRLNWVLEDVDG